MKPKTPRHHRSWTLRLFEWGVLVCVILILAGVFLRKVRYLQAEAERLNVQAMVENMRAAVLMASLLHKDDKKIRSAARPGGNPVVLFKVETGLEPAGYLGELDGVDPASIAPGKWYFDRGQAALVYRLRSTNGFESSLPGPARIRLCLKKADAIRASDTLLVIEPCESYIWARLN